MFFRCACCGQVLSASACSRRALQPAHVIRSASLLGWQLPSQDRHKRLRGRSRAALATKAAASEVAWPSTDTDLVRTGNREPLLSFDRSNYHTIALEGCEYLFAITPDGRLDLRDAVVYYTEEDMYLRPETEGQIPEEPLHCEEVEWAAEFTGDTVKGKPATKKVQRVYLIEVIDTESFNMNLDTVVMLDRKTRKLTHCSVEHAPGVTDDSDNVLRVTEAGLVLQRAEDMPSPDDVIEAHEAAKGGAQQQAPRQDAGEEKLDPIEAGWDDELGKPEDTPAIDFLGE